MSTPRGVTQVAEQTAKTPEGKVLESEGECMINMEGVLEHMDSHSP
jgi:hypothetical protein